MPLTAIFTQRRPSIGSFTFDAMLEESDDLVSHVTQYPVENGDVANDFVNTRNTRISMLVGVSNNRFRALAADASSTTLNSALADLGIDVQTARRIVSTGSSVAAGVISNALSGTGAALAGIGASIANASYVAGQSKTRSQSAVEAIRELQESGQPFNLITSKRNYKNVVITRTQFTTNPENEEGLELLVEMEALRIFQSTFRNEAVTLPPNDSAAVQASLREEYGSISAEPLE